MNQNFWLIFAVNEAVSLAEAILAANKNLTPAQTKALQDFTTASAEIVEAF